MAFTLKKLSELYGVSGCEDEVRSYIINEIQDKCNSLDIDSMGNIIAFKMGVSDEHKVMLASNIDEVGLIVSEITEKGFIKFKSVGNIDARQLISKKVTIGRKGILGVIGMKAIHVTTKDEREKAVKISELYIDIGAKNKKKAEKKVSLGDYITFDTDFNTAGDCIKGKAFDRLGTACLVEAMNVTPYYDTYFVFSTQREIPCRITGRGLKIAAYRIQPDIALIVETVNTADTYKSKHKNAELGKGAVIEFMDRTSIADVKFTSEIEKLAQRNDIHTQHMNASHTVGMAGAAQTAGHGVLTASIAIPCRYAHSPVSFMNKNDINAVTAICSAVIKESDVILNEIVKETD